MDILIALLFALALITPIGHGIWVLLAMIYRELTGADPRRDCQPHPVRGCDTDTSGPRST